MHLIKSTDFQMRCYNISINHKRLRKLVMFWLVFCVIGVLVLTAFAMYSVQAFHTDRPLYIYFIIYIVFIMHEGVLSATVTNYVYLIMNMNSRLDALNKLME